MKLSFIHVNDDGPDPERACRIPPAAEGARGHGRDVDVRLYPARNSKGAGTADASGCARPAARASCPAPETQRDGRDSRGTRRAVIVLDASALLELILG